MPPKCPQAPPSVAIKICWAISFLATESDGNLLTPFFQQIVQVRPE